MIKKIVGMIQRNKTISIILLILVALTVIYLLPNQGPMTSDQRVAKENANKEQAITLMLAEVSKVMTLPEGIPQIFDVTDPEALIKQQAFFVGSIAGDKVLIYPAASKAIIWSPSRGKIVNAGPLSTEQAPAVSAAQAPAVSAAQVTTGTKIDTMKK
jgi:hypothetical protein